MNIVVLDGYAANPGDLCWDELQALGECTIYDRTAPAEVLERAAGAEILLTNKTVLTAEHMAALPELKYIGVPRLAFIIATFTFVVYLIPGMFGAPLKALAGYFPPQETIDFDINRIVRDNVKQISVSGVATGTAKKSDACEAPKYSDFLHLAHGLDGYFDYDQALKCAQAQNKPLFIDFTGHGCVNCREMEQSVWSDPRVLDMLKNDYVVVALYVDDKTTLPESEWYVSDYDGKKKKKIKDRFFFYTMITRLENRNSEVACSCPNCGAVNENLMRSADGIPKTIEELKAFSDKHNLPLKDMRFFLGEDFKEPKAVSIHAPT